MLYHNRVGIIYVVETRVSGVLIATEYGFFSFGLVFLEVTEVIHIIDDSSRVGTWADIVWTIVSNSIIHIVSSYSIVGDDRSIYIELPVRYLEEITRVVVVYSGSARWSICSRIEIFFCYEY
jgi:hypothetical protein